MKVLAIGDGADQVARQFWEDAQIDKTELRPGKKRTDYDAVVSYHALPSVSIRENQSAVNAWVECLKQGGELHLFTPSLEWAAEQILAEEPSPALPLHLYGLQRRQGEFYISGYTMRDLRYLCDKAGLAVKHARAGTYTIGEHECEMHLVIGVKR